MRAIECLENEEKSGSCILNALVCVMLGDRI